ncbi:helicase associated domain-containing protein [Pseudarthrobacter albicanus]|uniref:helicase associated domain-containing protein n=1 Tax=Pseudarthrobacter albicanus TaxID=2823873 RepID=UPI001BABDF9E|nr:helicase associated domain-containing protein [Pseudarthrobacter albicanus]
MDRRLRRAPDAEWVLMYRLGLGRARIAALVRVPPAAVGYHLGIARRRDPGLEAEHQAAAGTAKSPGPSPRNLARMGLARMEEVIAWASARGRLPEGRSGDRGERSMARWLSARRREAAAGTLDPAYSDGLVRVPGWLENRREAADEARWHHRLARLVAFRQEGNDWPRHHHCDSDLEHELGVWIHVQRDKRRRGKLDPVKAKLLDDAVPGWRAGRTRGRPPRQ